MATIQQQRAKLNRLLADLPELGTALMRSYAETSVSLRKESSIETGINKDGQDGAKVAYSEKKVPSYYLKGKELNQAGRAYLEKNKTANWYGLRQAQGLRSKNVTLTYSGDMWKRYGVLSVTVTSGHVTAKVGLSGPSDVFFYNVDRYGKFYLNTPRELVTLRADVERESHGWLTRYLS